MSQIRTLRFFRLDPTTKKEIPWEIDLNERNVAVRDEPARTARAHAPGGQELPANVIPEDASPALRRQLENIRSRGISFRLNSQGGIDLFDYPELELQVGRFFNEHEPCLFDGCEEMRRAYQQDMEALTEGAEGCDVRCAETKLTQQYAERVRQILQRHEQSRVGSSGDQSVSTPAAAAAE